MKQSRKEPCNKSSNTLYQSYQNLLKPIQQPCKHHIAIIQNNKKPHNWGRVFGSVCPYQGGLKDRRCTAKTVTVSRFCHHPCGSLRGSLPTSSFASCVVCLSLLIFAVIVGTMTTSSTFILVSKRFKSKATHKTASCRAAGVWEEPRFFTGPSCTFPVNSARYWASGFRPMLAVVQRMLRWSFPGSPKSASKMLGF